MQIYKLLLNPTSNFNIFLLIPLSNFIQKVLIPSSNFATKMLILLSNFIPKVLTTLSKSHAEEAAKKKSMPSPWESMLFRVETSAKRHLINTTLRAE